MAIRRDYWDIEQLLAEEESVPAVFNTTVHQMGFLDQASEEEDVLFFLRPSFTPKIEFSYRYGWQS